MGSGLTSTELDEAFAPLRSAVLLLPQHRHRNKRHKGITKPRQHRTEEPNNQAALKKQPEQWKMVDKMNKEKRDTRENQKRRKNC